MKNEKRHRAEQVALPVPPGTVAGDPVVVGALVGVAATDRDADTPGEATVKMVGSFDLEVEAVDGEEESAIVVGDKLFIDGEGNITKTEAGGTFFGYALEAVAKGETATIEVKLATP